MSKVGASAPVWGARQVLRTMAASSASKVAKLCSGVPSRSVRLAAFASAFSENFKKDVALIVQGKLSDADNRWSV